MLRVESVESVVSGGLSVMEGRLALFGAHGLISEITSHLTAALSNILRVTC